jgi:hypothetical protein
LASGSAGSGRARTSGAIGVWRQASSRCVGSPDSMKAANAAVRRSRSQLGSEAAAFESAKRSKPTRYVSFSSLTAPMRMP